MELWIAFAGLTAVVLVQVGVTIYQNGANRATLLAMKEELTLLRQEVAYAREVKLEVSRIEAEAKRLSERLRVLEAKQ